jgi:hypothetical protein
LGPAARLLLATLAFALVSAGLRAALTTDHPPDEAEMIVAAQTLEGGYTDQPPLYTWLLWAATHFTGPGFAAPAVIRGALIVALVGITYATARLLVPDRRLVVPVACSSLLFPTFAWHSVTYLTHTLLLAVAVMATLYAVARVVRGGEVCDYLGLGAAVAFGVFAKYNFAFVVVAAVGAGLAVPETRRRLLDRRILLSVGFAGLLLSPHLAWLAEWSDEVLYEVRLKTHRQLAPPYWVGVGRGLWAGAAALGPCLALAVPVCWLAGRGAHRLEPADPLVSWLGRFLAGIALVHVGLVFACGVTRFADRWLQPFLLPLPVWYFARRAPGTVSPGRLLWLTVPLVLLAGALLIVQLAHVPLVDRLPCRYDMRLDYPGLAREFEEAGYGGATLVGWDREILGNLRVHMQGTRMVHATAANTFERPPGRVLVVWDEGRWGAAPPWARTPRFSSEIPRTPDPGKARRFTLRPLPPCRRAVTLLVCELPAE